MLGVSNISFGLPQRELINAAFFTMAMNNGLSAGIINPNAKAMRQAYDTFCVLGGYDAQCMNYIENYAVTDAPNAAAKPAAAKLNLTDSIIKGLKDQAYRATEEVYQDSINYKADDGHYIERNLALQTEIKSGVYGKYQQQTAGQCMCPLTVNSYLF